MPSKETRLNDIGIRLTREEIDCLKSILPIFELLKNAKEMGYSLPDEKQYQSVKQLQTKLETDLKRLSRFSRIRKFNTLPVSFVLELIIAAFISTTINVDVECLKVLAELNAKIRAKLIQPISPIGKE